MNCGCCSRAWTVPAEKPEGPVHCPNCEAHICACGCGTHLIGMRADSVFNAPSHREALRRAGWSTTAAATAHRAVTGATIHPLAEVRTEQEQVKEKARWALIVREHMARTLLETGFFHADDLDPLGIPEEHRNIAGSQSGGFVARGVMTEIGRRASAKPSRKKAKSAIYEITEKGRAELTKLVGLSDNDKGGGDAADNARLAPGNAGLPSGAPVGVAESGENQRGRDRQVRGAGSGGPTKSWVRAPSTTDTTATTQPARPSDSPEPETLFGESAYERLQDAA